MKTFPYLKRLPIHPWRIGGLLFLLLSACAPVTPAASPTPAAGPSAAQTNAPVESTATAGITDTPAATALSGPSFTNPVYNDDFPDPSVLLDGNTYYAYGTTNGSTVNIRTIKSEDLVNWQELGDALTGRVGSGLRPPGQLGLSRAERVLNQPGGR